MIATIEVVEVSNLLLPGVSYIVVKLLRRLHLNRHLVSTLSFPVSRPGSFPPKNALLNFA
jgi:hypothetical protein